MNCAKKIENSNGPIICQNKQICPYQYFCNKQKKYVFSDKVTRCPNYEQTKNQ